jgi:hypothetical protein
MRLGLRHCISALALLLSAACADAPTSPVATSDSVGPSEHAWIPGDGECDPWQDLSWCDDPGDPGDGTCVTSEPGGGEDTEEHVGSEGCGTGGGGTTAPSPTESDTCKTGNTVIDDPAVEAGFKELWRKSGVDQPQAQRMEHAAWIIRNADGTHSVQQITSYYAQGPCSVNHNMNAPPGAVGWIHTHPFRTGETMQACGALKREVSPGQWVDWIGPNGQPLYPRYNNQPSQPDREVIKSVNVIRKQQGQPGLQAYMIDNEGITRYGANGGKDQSFTRCGY